MPGAQSILIVDDEPGLRRLYAQQLAGVGYAVREAASGARALESLEGPDGPVDLLLTDIFMPGMSGLQLADRVRAAYPATRVLYMTADIDAPEVEGVELGLLLQKPFTHGELLARVRAVLPPPRAAD